jgi:hypothetical protein
MSFPAHALCVGVFKTRLTALSKLLRKAEAHCAAKKIDPAVMLGLRLAPDMFPLSRQVQLSTDFAKGATARLAGVEIPKYVDDEKTFDELQARIAKTIAFMESVPASAFEGAEARDIEIQVRGAPMRFKGDDYLVNFATAQFYFHFVAAYALMRQGGVEIGKLDYMGVG